MFMQHYECIYAGLCIRAHTHVRTAALLQSSRCCLLTAFVLFFLPLSNLSSPAKKCFLPPCGSVHTDTTFQLSEERQTENWVDKSEELLTVKCFTRRFCSFSFLLLSSLPYIFVFVYHFSPIPPRVSHNSARSYLTAFSSSCVSQRKSHIARRATKRSRCVQNPTGF